MGRCWEERYCGRTDALSGVGLSLQVSCCRLVGAKSMAISSSSNVSLLRSELVSLCNANDDLALVLGWLPAIAAVDTDGDGRYGGTT